MSSDRPQDVADIITALGADPTPQEVYHATQKYDTDYLASAAAALAAAGGGGGSSSSVTDGTTTVDPASSILFPPGTVTDLGGGEASVAPVTGLAFYKQDGFGTPQSVNPDSSTLIAWTHIGGAAFLNVSNPTHPTIVDAGVYAFMLQIWNNDAEQVGKEFAVALELDANNEDIIILAKQALTSMQISPQNGEVGLQPTMKLAAGAVILLSVQHNATGALGFAHLTAIQRIS